MSGPTHASTSLFKKAGIVGAVVSLVAAAGMSLWNDMQAEDRKDGFDDGLNAAINVDKLRRQSTALHAGDLMPTQKPIPFENKATHEKGTIDTIRVAGADANGKQCFTVDGKVGPKNEAFKVKTCGASTTKLTP